MDRPALALALAAVMPTLARAQVPPGCVQSANGYTCPISTANYPTALCNDGNPGAFSLRPSPDKSTTWIIWLEGGSECFNNSECYSRYQQTYAPLNAPHYYTTATNFVAQAGVGVLSRNARTNPDFYDANVVVVHYCSSDQWSGNKTPAPMTSFDSMNAEKTWYFEGHALAAAAVETILQTVPDFTSASTLILGGSSAGGAGMTYNANDILPLLPKAVAAHTLFINDAGFALDIGQYSQNYPQDEYVYPRHPNAFETELPMRLAFWTGTGDPACLAAGQPEQNCFNSSYVLQQGYIDLPSFVAESQLDTAQSTQELCPTQYGMCPNSHDPMSNHGIYETAFASAMMKTVEGSGTQAAYSAYSPDQFMHVILGDENVFNDMLCFPGPSGEVMVSPQAALDVWYKNTAGPRQVMLGDYPGVSGPTLGGKSGGEPPTTCTANGMSARSP